MSPCRLLRELQTLMLILFMTSIGNCQTRMTVQQYRHTVHRSDRSAPGWENFDPTRANPVRNITCLGDSLDLRLPMLGNFDPNHVSAQKVCAKPQYNGGAPGEHAGGYCSEPPFINYTGDVAFDKNPDAHASSLLQNPRVLLACRYRCFCNWNVADTSIQPKTKQRGRGRRLAVQSTQSENSYELRLDVDDDFFTSQRDHRGQFGMTTVDTLRLLRQSQLSREAGQSPMAGMYNYVSLDPGNKIVCSGNMPTFQLPQPYTARDYLTQGPNPVQRLCATQLSGGSTGANAGAYCHRSDTPAGPRSDVWFSDSVTPRLDWTWGGGSFVANAALRFFCWQHCTCASDRNRVIPNVNFDRMVWPLLPGHSFMQMPDGSYYLVGVGSTGTARSMQILPSQAGVGSHSGYCGPNGTDFCPSTWDKEMLGPVPLVPPDTTDIIQPTQKGNSTVCGNACYGPSDCGSTTTSEYSCSCAFPSSYDARKLGLDPVAPAAICLALFITSVQTKLGGRDIPTYVDARGMPYTCRCNETLTGAECCGAVNGLQPIKLFTVDRSPSNRPLS